MQRILFVCLGNICRSPMAEAIFNHKIKQKNLDSSLISSSAGTSSLHKGEPPHIGTRTKLKEYNIDDSYIFSSPLNKNDSSKYSYIIAMDNDNLKNINKVIKKEENCEICLLSDFSNEDSNWIEVPDPWYTGDFDLTYRLIDEATENLINHIKALS